MPRNEDRVYVGIDPGWGGAIAAVCRDAVTVESIPEDEQEMFDVLETIQNVMAQNYGGRVVLEKVGGFIGTRPGGGAHRNLASGHTMFKFGWCYGALRMCLIAHGMIGVTTHVTPQVWQKAIGVACKTKGESQNSFKNRLKDRAIELFPNVKVTLKNADALLLAHYCKMLNEEL